VNAQALTLILSAAVIHATWNLLAKRVSGGAAFVWVFSCVAVCSYTPLAIGVGIMHPLSYVLVLTALAFTPVSYVAPAREISILIGALMGTRLLAEGNTCQRLIAAAAMAIGVVALALG
jgi:uncharacterized membrane protein